MIKVRDIIHRYDSANEPYALNGIDLTISEGEYISIIGQSGSGKTTLLNIMSGLMRPTSGIVYFNDFNLYELSQKQIAIHRNHNIGFIFQNYYLEPKFSVFENVSIPLLNDNKNKKEDIIRKVNYVLELVGLTSLASNLASNLSGGERQRVAIARAIVMQPQIIFADEPTGNLDTKNGKIIMDILKDLNDKGTTIILVTHNELQAQSARRTIRLEDGKIIEEFFNE